MKNNNKFWIDRYEKEDKKKIVGAKAWDDNTYIEANNWFFNKMDSILSKMAIPCHGNVVDFGVGIGRCKEYLTNKFFPKKYIGYDIYDNNVKDIEFRLIKEDAELNINEEISVIWSYVTLQHIMDNEMLKYYIRQLIKSMDKEGLWISTEAVGKYKEQSYLKYRTVSKYCSLFEDFGLKIIKIERYKIFTGKDHATFILKKE